MSLKWIDDYEILDTIGIGTVGTIFKAVKEGETQPVAIKLLLPAVSENELICRRFEREIEILEKLNHPNVVRYFGSGKWEDQLYYVMELVEGASLREVLNRKGRVRWQETVEVGWQVCSALQHAHNNGIIHRDLKPANLFLSNDGRVKLGDFGTALDTASVSITEMGLTVGTYYYMAPEQIRAERSISGQTDLYSLGCVLYEMLTGQPPFRGENSAQIFDQHLNVPPFPIRQHSPSCPEKLEAVVLQMLEKDPHNRPFNARSAQGALAEALVEWDENELKRIETQHAASESLSKVNQPILKNLLISTNHEITSEDISWVKLTVLSVVVITIILLIVMLGD
ncbi:Serine/threonine-protein kinase PrkC [Polystyrenella longa]|uniref:non-specific serine/threonine protein kinase n=1 Tax=Polystyrenella longa TaxID=2528007 RepID=A0A518CSR3_9PLAN|nr:serine/threonine-protein kinase [Polystyrenella longa]QDU82258.1 Serine/threonine-protein kinase PrkC [Polystyrenella longa]